MPRKPSLAGIIARDAHIQVDLRAQGFGRERLELPPTPANLSYAARVRNEILAKIERGTFVLAEYFPDSPRVKADTASLTWEQLRDEWLETKKVEIEHSTLHHYRQTLRSYHFKDWNPLFLGDLDYRKLKIKLGALPANAKTFNNIATVLAMALEYGYKGKLLRDPLHKEVKLRTPDDPQPDPFELPEVEEILGKMRKPEGLNFYEFAFFSGLRPSELIALRWSHVDRRAGTVKVQRAFTRAKEKGTKTKRVRTVELNSRALAAINRQHELTGAAGDHVFVGLDGEPYTTTDGPLDAYWKPAFAQLPDIRYRDARQTRHTYATVCLHAGLTPAWAAKQLGHSTRVFFTAYAHWIEGADRGAERRRLDDFIAGKSGTKNGT